MERTQSKGKNCKLNFVEPIQLLMASCLTWGLNLDLLSCPFSFSLNFEIAVTLYDALTDVLRLSWGGVSVGCWGWLWISAAFIFRVQKYVAGVRTPARGRDFLFSKNYVDRLWGQPSCLFSGYRSFCPRVKRPGRDADHWSATSAEAKNEWSCTSTPPICVRSWQLYILPFTVLYFMHFDESFLHPFPLAGCSHRLQYFLSFIKDHFAPSDLIFSTEEGGSSFFWNMGNIATSPRLCQSKNGITIPPRLVTLVSCLSSHTLYRIWLLAYVCHSHSTSFQMYEGSNFNSGNYLFTTDTK